MKISIITPTFNSKQTIKDTLESVLVQTHRDCEHIIVDGGSTDGTLSIVNTYRSPIHKVISEPDRGIYDAMNKGIHAATGDVVAVLNSDDFYATNDVLETVVKVFIDQNADVCYGDVTYVAREDKNQVVRYWPAGDYSFGKLRSGWIPPHPAVFIKKFLYTAYGYFNLEFPIAADYELMLRFFTKAHPKIRYLKKNIAFMREGGHSAKNIAQRMRGWRELRHAWRINQLSPPLFFILRRLISKVPQYLVKS